MIEYRIEESVWFPRRARTEPVVGAPIDKLAAAGADRSGGQMQAQAAQQTEGEPPGTLEHA
jgi:hypothetical protein